MLNKLTLNDKNWLYIMHHLSFMLEGIIMYELNTGIYGESKPYNNGIVIDWPFHMQEYTKQIKSCILGVLCRINLLNYFTKTYRPVYFLWFHFIKRIWIQRLFNVSWCFDRILSFMGKWVSVSFESKNKINSIYICRYTIWKPNRCFWKFPPVLLR